MGLLPPALKVDALDIPTDHGAAVARIVDVDRAVVIADVAGTRKRQLATVERRAPLHDIAQKAPHGTRVIRTPETDPEVVRHPLLLL